MTPALESSSNQSQRLNTAPKATIVRRNFGEYKMRSNSAQFRLDIVAEPSHRWRWQIFEGEHLVMQSEAIYATRGDANRAGIVEQWQLITEIEGPRPPLGS